jgi:hypothetical protein
MATATRDPFECEVTSGGNFEYQVCPPGSHLATIIGLYHVGHVPEKTPRGEVEINSMVMVFELTKRDPNGRPFVLAQRYNLTMNVKSNLYSDVAKILGNKPREKEKFSPAGLIGTPVMLLVTNTVSDGKTYHNVESVGQFPEGLPHPEPIHPEVVWSVARDEDGPPPDAPHVPWVFGRSIKALAGSSAEHRERERQAAGAAAAKDDDIPF